MSIVEDLRAYADSAVTAAQAQFSELSDAATDFVGTYGERYRTQYVDQLGESVTEIANAAAEALTELRATAGKAVNADALLAALEPYLAQAREYGVSVSDRAEELFETLAKDPRFAKLVETANEVSSTLLVAVTEHVVAPVRTFTGRPSAARTAKPARETKPAATKPAASRPAASRPAATKPAATATTTTAKTTTSRATTSRAATGTPAAAKPAASKPTAPKPTAKATSTRTRTTSGTTPAAASPAKRSTRAASSRRTPASTS